jgi:hypothetical protein
LSLDAPTKRDGCTEETDAGERSEERGDTSLPRKPRKPHALGEDLESLRLCSRRRRNDGCGLVGVSATNDLPSSRGRHRQ